MPKSRKVSETVAVIGLGYVGLPLALTACEAGFEVVGIDIDRVKVKNLENGISGIDSISNKKLSMYLESKKLIIEYDYRSLKNASVILFCVPTPLNYQHKPDLLPLIASLENCAHSLRQGALVIIESTVAPGTMRQIVLKMLSINSKVHGHDFFLAYSPERIDPANQRWNIQNTPKLVSGISISAREKAVNFYQNFIKTIEICDSVEIAETAKLLENSFRLVNISLVNELSMMCRLLKVDVAKVISAANTKPYGFMAFYPSIGAGGHCIPVDPVYLSDKAEEIGSPLRMIELASQINKSIPEYFVKIVENMIGDLKEKKILVIGISYKSNVADIRESAAISLILSLRKKGAFVSWHDDLVIEWDGEKSTPLSDTFDLAIITTAHNQLEIKKLGNVPKLDTRNSL
jgi:UDP-N-acetyl-D-glucosamine dehydrogenase